MGLFSKKPIETSSHAPLYTLGNQNTVLIVGLGNPGKEYDSTRHNVGFAALDAFVAANDTFDNWIQKKDLKCLMTTGTFGASRVIAIKPTTFMNESGQAVQAVQNFYKISTPQTVVVHDELDIEFGQIRTRAGGGSAGHNGIKSIVSHAGDAFGRVRIGINSQHRTKHDEKDFVLKPFSKDEQAQIDSLNREVISILTEYIYGGTMPVETRSFLL